MRNSITGHLTNIRVVLAIMILVLLVGALGLNWKANQLILDERAKVLRSAAIELTQSIEEVYENLEEQKLYLHTLYQEDPQFVGNGVLNQSLKDLFITHQPYLKEINWVEASMHKRISFVNREIIIEDLSENSSGSKIEYEIDNLLLLNRVSKTKDFSFNEIVFLKQLNSFEGVETEFNSGNTPKRTREKLRFQLKDQKLDYETLLDIYVEEGDLSFLAMAEPVKGMEYAAVVVATSKKAMISSFYDLVRWLWLGVAIIALVLVYIIFIVVKRLENQVSAARKKYQQSEKLVNQYQMLMHYSDDFIFRHNDSREYDYVSENVLKVLGYTPEEFISRQQRKFTQNSLNSLALVTSKRIIQGEIDEASYMVEVTNAKGVPCILEIQEKAVVLDNGKRGVIGIAKDISERYHSEERFKVLFENTSVPHILSDESGILDCNDAAVKLFGVTDPNELMYKSPFDFAPEFQPSGEMSSSWSKRAIERAAKLGYFKFDWQMKRADGSLVPLEIGLTPVNIVNRKVLLSVWSDLSERKSVESALIKAKRNAEIVAESKQNFLSSVSHEIRTPLNAILGYTNLLEQSHPRPDQLEKLESLNYSANNLLNLVNDVLDISRIESGRAELTNQPFSIEKEFNGVCKSLEILSEKKPIEFTWNIGPDVPEMLSGDAMRCSQVFHNIVNNALKFTEKGTVKVDLKKIEEEERFVTLRFSCEDTGIGMDEKSQELVFEKFRQANNKILNEFGGTGLGLAITRELVLMMSGKVWLESEAGKGTTFYVDLPFSKVEGEKKEEETRDLSSETLEGLEVLLVEDNPLNQRVASEFMKLWGIQVSCAENGQEGVDVVKNYDYDMVLMDLQMPVLDGYEATKAIRALEKPKYQRLPIITLTADAYQEVEERTKSAGMNGYLTKPLHPDNFKEKLLYFKAILVK